MSERAPYFPFMTPARWLAVGAMAAATLVLALGYAFFLQPTYVVLATELRPADAAAIVAALDKAGTPHRLRDGGKTILVPDDQADATRLAISGVDISSGNQPGFELFNKSDMGLTSFAQKINYQRALQGELTRTLTQMEGVESTRVHLALPEHSVFRGDHSEPKAAVTVAMRPGFALTPDRVVGIQRLVAAAVTDLPASEVVVLDAQGRLVSADVVDDDSTGARSADTDERSAIAHYYEARARRAIEAEFADLKFVVRAVLLPIGSGPTDDVPSVTGNDRNFMVRVVVVTQHATASDQQQRLSDLVRQADQLDPTRGDSVTFEQGPINRPAPSPTIAPSPIASSVPASTLADPAASASTSAWSYWPLLGLLVVPLILLALRKRSTPTLSSEEHRSFADRLRRQLNLGGGDAVA